MAFSPARGCRAPCPIVPCALTFTVRSTAILCALSTSIGCGKNDAAPSGPFTTRVSIATGGAEATGGHSGVPAVSADGRFIAFASDATNLVPDDTNGQTDVFVYDAATGQTTRVSLSNAGTEATGGGSRSPAISADGRLIAFESDATNLVANDTNGVTDVFLRDRATGETTRISVASNGAQAIGLGSFGPAISSDGEQIAFVSGAANLTLGDTNGLTDVFVRDRIANVTTRVSVSTGGGEIRGPAGSLSPSLSANGQFVAFVSAATDVVANDTNNTYDVFLRDRLNNVTTRVSVADGGAQAVGGPSDNPAVSADGRYVVFHSDAGNLVSNDTNNAGDVFVRDIALGRTTRVSVDSQGLEGNGASTMRDGGFSGDGRFVVFQSAAGNLVADDTNGAIDIFVHDQSTGKTTRQSVTSAGAEAGGGDSGNPVISSDGAVVVFDSFAANLVADDTNGQLDVFRASRR